MTDQQLTVTEFPEKLNRLPPDQRDEARVARASRKVFATTFSVFVRTMRECMTAYHAARAQGVERSDAAKGIEAVLRDSWSKARSKFSPRCDDCEDGGWQELICKQYKRCSRQSCQQKGDEWQHRYVVPCMCPAGGKFRARPPIETDAVVAAGRQKRQKSFTRFGS